MVSLSTYPLRFFSVVRTQPPLIVWTFSIVTLVASAAIAHDPDRASGAMAPVLLLQLFAASSGFEVPARRGHYDLLLTSGHRRVWMALVHWSTSVAPGLMAWLILVGMEAAASGGAASSLRTTGTLIAMALVSTLPWAITVRLPRFSGGIGWLLALSISTSVWPASPVPVAFGTEFSGTFESVWAVLVSPATLVGRVLGWQEMAIVASASLLAVGSMAAACRWVSRASVPLEAAQ